MVALEQIQPVDILVFQFDRMPQHVGLAAEYNCCKKTIIHAYVKRRAVTEHGMDKSWEQKVIAAYRFHDLVTSFR